MQREVAEQTPTSRMVLLGDSVTVGAGFSGVTIDTTFPQQLARQLQDARMRLQVVPSALDGVDTAYALRRFHRMVTRLEPEHVLIMLGVNDARPTGSRPPVSPTEFARNLRELVERVFEIPAQPWLASPNPRLENTGLHTRDIAADYARVVREIGAYYEIEVIDIHRRFLEVENLSSILPDGLHPDPHGQELIARTIASTLRVHPACRDCRTT